MENLLRKYMEDRFREQTASPAAGGRPFITISREFGCPSKMIAQLLADTLNEQTSLKKEHLWRFVNKEIVIESAHELDLSPEQIQYLFNAEKKGSMDDIFSSFSDHYKSDRTIKKTIQEVVRSFVRKGNIILVGRGGVAITKNYSHALHIRLMAPLAWRVQGVCYRHGITETEAISLIRETDKRRNDLIGIFLGKPFDLSLFDLVFNCQTFDPDEIVQGIVRMMEVKSLI